MAASMLRRAIFCSAVVSARSACEAPGACPAEDDFSALQAVGARSVGDGCPSRNMYCKNFCKVLSCELQRLNCEDHCRRSFGPLLKPMDDYCEKGVCGEESLSQVGADAAAGVSGDGCEPKWSYCVLVCTAWPNAIVDYDKCEEKCTKQFGKLQGYFQQWCACSGVQKLDVEPVAST
mmetsp:Transcript_11477/g.32629  ORF Transcript_11477/g.32629 Transcript_11477/m.32629 type:complete len:177 (+) Transcript_11477:74-604(+)